MPGARIGVVEPSPPPALDELRSLVDPDIRVFAITPASGRILDSCRVWEDIADVRAPAFTRMQVWESVGSGYVRFGSDGTGALGFVAENRVLASAVYDRLRALATGASGLRLFEGTTLKSLSLPPHSPGAALGSPPQALARVETADGRVVRARLVVGADGGGSATRSLAGVGSWAKDYEQHGVVASVRLTGDNQRTAWQRFLPAGPLALLPLWNDMSSIVWSVPPSEAARLKALPGPDLAAEINSAFAQSGSSSPDAGASQGGAVDIFAKGAMKLSRAMQGAAHTVTKAEPMGTPPLVKEVVGAAASFPLRMAGANEYARSRLALVGDAAHTVHPLAGQGLNLGLGDADALARTLARGAEAGRDVGSLSLLREYDGERRAQVQGMQTALDIIKAVFAAGGNRPGVPSAVRTAGMSAIHALGPLKNEMAAFAMGSDSSAAAKVVGSVGAFLSPSLSTPFGSGR